MLQFCIMVKVFPFAGLSYNKKKLKKFNKVISPPYDVISPEEQAAYYKESDFNVVRLILGKEFPGDTEYNNRYVRAAAFMSGWLRHKILLLDDKPAFYVYEQRFSVGGKKYSRIGFIGIIRLEDMGKGKVYPHEETFPKAKLDRLQLMRATNANLDCIFSLYSDKKGKIDKVFRDAMRRKPLIDTKDPTGAVNRVWRLDNKSAINRLTNEMKDKPVFIADGHHRYEAAIRFKEEMKIRNTKFTEDEAYNHVMMYFTPLEGKGLVILPIHRVVRPMEFFDPIRFEQDLGIYFEVTPYPAKKTTNTNVRRKLLKDLQKAGETKHAFALYLGNYRYYLLILRTEELIDEMVEEEKPRAWKHLDVTILHYSVFDRLLGIGHETEDKVIYVKDDAEAFDLVDKKQAAMAFIMNATKIEEIIAVASDMEKMPHKSTYFYPKLTSGLIMRRFEHGEKVK